MNISKYLSFILIGLMCLTAHQANAKWEYVNSNAVSNPNAGMTPITVQDPQLAYMIADVNWSNRFTNLHSKVIVSLELDKVNGQLLTTITTIEALVEIERFNQAGQSMGAATQHPLIVKYDPNHGVNEIDISSIVVEGGFKYEVKLIDLLFNGVQRARTSSDPDYFLKVSYEVERAYKKDFSGFTGTPPAPGVVDQLTLLKNSVSYISPNSCASDLEIKWDAIDVAEAYELEWLFWDINQAANAPYTFRNNSSRIRVETTSARIPLIYEEGYLLFRVRPIAINENRVETPLDWSNPESSSSNPFTYNSSNPGDRVMDNFYYVAGHTQSMNWQTVTVFAEEGKKAQQLAFYDGTMRNRQSIALNNVEQQFIVSQTIFDHVGRPAVQIMPSPDNLNPQSACYRYAFNQSNASNQQYNWTDFDKMADPNNPCGEIKVNSLSTSTGASNYFSSSNPVQTTYNSMIPDAQGYPMMQVEYTPDNTGRIARQGGVGKAHRLSGQDENSNTINAHETQFNYTIPAENQLTRLFGNEVGAAEHYKRNIVKDANGQHSVSYIDPYGRTIATALAGDPSNTPNVQALSSANSTYRVKYNLDASKNTVIDNSLIQKITFHKTIQGNIDISYNVTNPTYTKTNCNQQDICFTCDYILELSLKDACGVEYIPQANRTQNVGTLDETTWNCTGNVQFTNAPNPMSINLPAGEYTFVKRLYLNQATADRYTLNYLSTLNGGCLKTYEQFLQEEIDKIESKFCNYDCTACEADLLTMNTQKTDLENTIANMSAGPEKDAKQKELDELILEINEQGTLCKALCNGTNLCESAKQGMLMDLIPGGQYMQLQSVSNTDGIEHQFTDQTTKTSNSGYYSHSLLLEDNEIQAITGNPQASWRYPTAISSCSGCYAGYVNENGTALSYILQEDGYPEAVSNAKYFDEDKNLIANPATYKGKKYVLPHELKYATDFVKYYEFHWANQLISYHPEYACWDHTCNAPPGKDDMSTIYDYENTLMKVATHADAMARGLYNPMDYSESINELPVSVQTTLPSGPVTHNYPAPSNNADKDPLLNASWMSTIKQGSQTWAMRFKEMLQQHNGISTGNSIWQLIIKQADEMTTTPAEANCWTDMNWLLFRSLYISTRQQLIAEYISSKSICIAPVPIGYDQRFIYKPNKVNKTVANSTGVNTKIETACEDQCASYADRWIKELSQCQDFATLLGNPTNRDLLIDRLKKVCEGGCDGSNAFGAINVSPSNENNAAYPDKNFEDAIKNWLAGINESGKFVPGVCDDLLITFPYKYGHDYLATADPESADCACDAEKTPGVPKPSNCPENHGTTLDAGDCACQMTKPEAKKVLLATKDLEDDMLCKNCISCQCMTDILRSFTKKYTAYNTWSEDQLKKTCEIYFNRELGFNLDISEYISFMRECTGDQNGNLLALIQTMEKRYMAKVESPLPLPHKPNFGFPKASFQWVQGKSIIDSNSMWSPNWKVPANNNQLTSADVIASTSSIVGTMGYTATDADKIACGCEKVLQAWYAFTNQTQEYNNVADAYNQIFGAVNCPNLDVTTAVNHCLELYGLGNATQGQNTYHPSKRFTPNMKTHITTIQPGGYTNTLDAMIGVDCPCNNSCLKFLDCCACKKLMEEELLWQNGGGTGTFDNFLKTKYPNEGSPMPGYSELLSKCKKFWEDGAGEDAYGNPIQWTSGQDPCTNSITKHNTATNALQGDLLLPAALSCNNDPCDTDPEPDPEFTGNDPGWGTTGSGQLYEPTIDCSLLKTWAEDYLSNNVNASISGLALRKGCQDDILKIVASYEKMRSEKVQNIHDPNVETWYNNFYTHMQSQWIAQGKQSDYANLEQLIEQLLNCAGPCTTPSYEGPCKGTNDCNKCYEVKTDYLAAFEAYLNQISGIVTHSAYNQSSNLLAFNYINDSLFITTQSNGPYQKIQATNWKMQNSVRTVDKYYNSVLYPMGQYQSLLKYYLESQNLTYGNEVKIDDNGNGHEMKYSMNYPKAERQNNLGEIVSFTNVELSDPLACYYPTKYRITSYQVVKTKYRNLPGVKELNFMGQTLFYYQEKVMFGYFGQLPVEPQPCFNPCAQLCNRPFLPVAELKEDPCKEILMENARYNAELRYRKYIESEEANFRKEYKEKCLNVIQEETKLEYDDYEYHHTLYYYDQAGNLVKTVPPAGVRYATGAVTTQHEKIANYQYNTLNQVVEQHTPDAGKSLFWYDNLGRIVVSQNAKQVAGNYYSYTLYDPLGRPTEVGELKTTSVMNAGVSTNPSSLSNWINSNTERRQVTRSFYDEIMSAAISNLFGANGQQNLRGRVASSFFQKVYNTDISVYDHATHYSYDIHGNVFELVQDMPELEATANRYKHINYEYDLLSGNVHKVSYQKGKVDMMIHRYTYDANNRLDYVETSTDGLHWEKDAKYLYYKHGPLARTEIGNLQVQGLDYSYTIHGWIKGINANTLDPNNDPGEDGKPLAANENFARDAFGFTLSFYDDGTFNDYSPINSIKTNFEASKAGSDLGTALSGKSLYNGNIMHMATALPNATDYQNTYTFNSHTVGNAYTYDQLNRLAMMQSFDNLNFGSNTWQSNGYDGTAKHHTHYSYDADGNLQELKRNGNQFTGPQSGNMGLTGDMDHLAYHYQTNTDNQSYYFGEENNRLTYVDDNATAPSATYANDFEDQNAGNYSYDAIGNLTQDVKEGIDEIKWNVYGKISEINRGTSNPTAPNLEFGYDVSGQRLYKIVKPRNSGILRTQDYWTQTWYVRDPQGNVMATYETKYESVTGVSRFKEELTLKQQSLYGSSRLGTQDRNVVVGDVEFTHNNWETDNRFKNKTYDVNTLNNEPVQLLGTPERVIVKWDAKQDINLERGHKQYELSNHLGNVLATVTDRKIHRLIASGGGGTIEYEADVVSINDYYPFGMVMDGRSVTLSGVEAYKYGFNTQEKDDEIYGQGNSTTALFWQYDARIGRRWNVDPKGKEYESSYIVNHGNPLLFYDPNGDEPPKQRTWLGKKLYATAQYIKGDYYKYEANEKALILQQKGYEVDIQYKINEEGREYAEINRSKSSEPGSKEVIGYELINGKHRPVYRTTIKQTLMAKKLYVYDKMRYVRKGNAKVTLGGRIAFEGEAGPDMGFDINVGSVTLFETKTYKAENIPYTEETYILSPEDLYNGKLRVTQGVSVGVGVVSAGYENERVGQKGELVHTTSGNIGPGSINVEYSESDGVKPTVGLNFGYKAAAVLGIDIDYFVGAEYYVD